MFVLGLLIHASYDQNHRKCKHFRTGWPNDQILKWLPRAFRVERYSVELAKGQTRVIQSRCNEVMPCRKSAEGVSKPPHCSQYEIIYCITTLWSLHFGGKKLHRSTGSTVRTNFHKSYCKLCKSYPSLVEFCNLAKNPSRTEVNRRILKWHVKTTRLSSEKILLAAEILFFVVILCYSFCKTNNSGYIFRTRGSFCHKVDHNLCMKVFCGVFQIDAGTLPSV